MATTFKQINEYAEGYAAMNPDRTIAQAYRQGFIDGYRDKNRYDIPATEPLMVTDDIGVIPTFEQFWNTYNKKRGRKNALKLWVKLPVTTQQKILEHVPLYVESTPDPQYRKDPCTYLRGECWNDEIVKPQQQQYQHAEPEFTFFEQSANLIGRLADKIRK